MYYVTHREHQTFDLINKVNFYEAFYGIVSAKVIRFVCPKSGHAFE